MIVEVPIRIESTPNLREHWIVRSKRAGIHRNSTYFALKAARALYSVPCVVTMTRIAPRELDDDNNTAGLKNVRDGVALWLGVDDADKRITWICKQAKRGVKDYSLLVEIVPGEEAAT